MKKVNEGVIKTIILARVSTDEQDSNDAQLNRLIDFAKSKGYEKYYKYPIKESSTKEDRKKLQEIIDEIKKSKGTIALFVDTIDRLQRSFRESVVFDDLRIWRFGIALGSFNPLDLFCSFAHLRAK